MKNIKVIIFDAYGTLFDVNSAAEKCKNKLEKNGNHLQIIGEQLSLNTLAKKLNGKTSRFLESY